MEPKDLIKREGFRVLRTNFLPPANTAQLESSKKRRITICNLFVNHRLAIKDIARVLDETYNRAVQTLIEEGIVQERRSVPREYLRNTEPILAWLEVKR